MHWPPKLRRWPTDRVHRRLFSWLIAALAALSPVNTYAHERLLVFAAASLTETLSAIAKAFETFTGTPVVISYAGTQQLARQLDAGAPASVFISADKVWLDWARERGLLAEQPATIFASNRLVLAVRNEVENWADAESLLTRSRFAMADPEAVPAGRYARQALVSKGWWEKAQPNAVFGENVRVTLKRVSLGEVSGAIVYATDAVIDANVRAVYTFDAESHDPIRYYAAATRTASKEAAVFLNFLETDEARAILKDAGFGQADALE